MDRIDLHIEQGMTAVFNFNVKDIAGQPFDLSEKTIFSEVKIAPEYEKLSFVPTIFVSNAEAGQIVWLLDAETTAKMKHCGYVYDICVISPGSRNRVIEGAIEMEIGVSR